MREEIMRIDGYPLRVLKTGTVVVGAGAAGLNAANELWEQGYQRIVIVTESIRCSTSRNAGSDKQTYYKISLCGRETDSVEEMAETLFSGGCVDGDTALAESANSVSAFLNLCKLGVPFPVNRYGEYVGYKTDHDPRRRGTSAGPLTSRLMTEVLEAAVRKKGIELLDGYLAVELLVQDGEVYGVLCVDTHAVKPESAFLGICCSNVIWATGGPAGMYADSAFPEGHTGMTGVPLKAGARGKNLTEWQYGLASVSPRWNVSGTYMQVLPRFYSTTQNGGDEREFLSDYFADRTQMLSAIFLKGYQWPFDARKAKEASSVIDLLVYAESRLKGRRVYLDYTQNAGCLPVDFDSLDVQAREYLRRAEGCFGTPIERLEHMNPQAIAFYRDHGLDLHRDPLEITLCAQHNNGGIEVDAWWQTCVRGLFAVGEAAGTHGIYRPGGSALNAGQVGGLRAARYIAAKRKMEENESVFRMLCQRLLPEHLRGLQRVSEANEPRVLSLWKEAQIWMSRAGGAVRNMGVIEEALQWVAQRLQKYDEEVRLNHVAQLSEAYHYRDALICEFVYLGAMQNYFYSGGKSRGSAIYVNFADKSDQVNLSNLFEFQLDDGAHDALVQLAEYKAGRCMYIWRAVRPIPERDDFFENVWRVYRSCGGVF